MISLIVATTLNDVIGRAGGMPWHLKADMKHFVATTMGKPVIMGRKTFESIGKPLKGRRTIVLTRDENAKIEGCEIVNTVAQALELLDDEPEVIVAGGAEVYRIFMDVVDRIYLTQIDCELEGDAFFPAIDKAHWKECSRSHQYADSDNDYNFDVLTLERVSVTA